MERNPDISFKASGKQVIYNAFRGITQSATAFLIILLPKCSICLAAYLNVFSLMGLSVAKYAAWILPVLSGVIVLSLAVSFSKARKLNDYRAFSWLATGSVILLVSRIWASMVVLNWVGFGIILIATVVQLVQSRRICEQDIFRI